MVGGIGALDSQMVDCEIRLNKLAILGANALFRLNFKQKPRASTSDLSQLTMSARPLRSEPGLATAVCCIGRILADGQLNLRSGLFPGSGPALPVFHARAADELYEFGLQICTLAARKRAKIVRPSRPSWLANQSRVEAALLRPIEPTILARLRHQRVAREARAATRSYTHTHTRTHVWARARMHTSPTNGPLARPL